MKQTKTILTPSLATFGFEFQEAVQDGWEIEEDKYVNMFGPYYEVIMCKRDSSVAALLSDVVIQEETKQLTPAQQRMANARASKGK
jgi:hypothetical protein